MSSSRKGFSWIALGFDSRLRAIRLLNTSLGPKAEEPDSSRIVEWIESLKEYIPTPPPQPAGDTGAEPREVVSAATQEGGAATAPVNNVLEIVKKLSWLASHPTEELHGPAKEFSSFVLSFFTLIHSQGELLRQSGLMVLESALENLLAQLWRWSYREWPGRLPAENPEYSLSLKKLRELKTVEAAEAYLLEKRVAKHLYASLADQLDDLDKKYRLGLAEVLDERPKLIELSQRRNLIVHNGGVVNRQYLEGCPRALLPADLKEGQLLKVSKEYFASAIETVYAAGLIIIFRCWRKWVRDGRDTAAVILNNLIMENLRNRNYGVAERLARFMLRSLTKEDTTLVRHSVTINLAMAVSAQRRQAEAAEVLSSHDWSGSALKFEVARFLILGQTSEALSALRRAVSAKELDVFDLDRWPLFDPVRADSEFARIRSTAGTRDRLAELFPGLDKMAMPAQDSDPGDAGAAMPPEKPN